MRRQFVWVAGGRIAAAVIQALMLLLLARSVAPADFGIFSAIFGLGVVAQNVFDLGLGTFVIRERARDSESPLLVRALQMNSGASLLMGLVGTTALLVTSLGDATFLTYIPLIVAMAVERNADVRLGLALADGKARINVTNLVTRRTFALVLFVPLTYLAHLDPIIAFGLASVAAATASALSAHLYIRGTDIERGTRTSVRTTLAAATPFWINSVATQARNLDALLVTVLAGPVVSGLYATASRLTGPLRILPTSLSAVLLPQATRLASDSAERRRWLRGVLKVTGVMLVFYGMLALVIPPLVPLVLGAEYAPSGTAVRIVLAGLVFAAAASLLSTTLQGWGDAAYVGKVAAVTTAVCLAAVGLGALELGASGAAIGLSLSFLVQAAALIVRALQVSSPSKNGTSP